MRVDASASFIHFVYPFLFEAETFAARVRAIESAQWQGRQSLLSVWETNRFPDDELLSHVARYLNPPAETPATARLWKLHDAMQEVYGSAGRAEWRLLWPRGEIPFQFGRVGKGVFAAQLALFHIGIGLLTVRVEPMTDELSGWLDCLHYFRFARGQRQTSLQAKRRAGIDSQTRQPQSNPFFPEPAGGVAAHPDGRGTCAEVLAALLRSGALTEEVDPWWREVFLPGQLLPFTGLFVDDVSQDGLSRVVYTVRNLFHSHQSLHPARADLQMEDHPALLPYAEGQWFVFSLEGGGFVAGNAPTAPFFRQTLPDHLRNEYFLLFELVLHQRFALMGLSEKVARHWLPGGTQGSDEEREVAFARIRDALLSFTARGHFTQVMQREHHHRCYRKWQDIFQVDRLYQEVSDEVRDMHEYLLMRRTERIERLTEEQRRQTEAAARAEAEREQAAQLRAKRLEGRFNRLALLLGLPALALTYVDVAYQATWTSAALAMLAGFVMGVIVLVALQYRRGHQ
jgi:hypothetical protein